MAEGLIVIGARRRFALHPFGGQGVPYRSARGPPRATCPSGRE